MFQLYYNKLSNIFFEDDIEILCYGCGQAIEIMVLADYLKENYKKNVIKKITLIEPSIKSLERGALHSSLFFPNAEIININTYIQDLNSYEIARSDSNNKLHILKFYFNYLTILADFSGFKFIS